MEKTMVKESFGAKLFDTQYSKLVPGQPVFIARVAQFIHRRGLTEADLKEMKSNFDAKVVGLDINFDYDHAEGRAAGWIKEIVWGEVDVDGKKFKALFAVPEWTPTGAKSVAEGEYRYTSPEVFWNWQHPEKGTRFACVLRRVAILNNPQITNQPAVKLSAQETTNTAVKKQAKGEQKKMEKLLKLATASGAKFSEGAEVTEDQLVAAFSEKIAGLESRASIAETKAAAAEGTLAISVAEVEKYKAIEVAQAAAAKKAVVDSIIKDAEKKIEPAKFAEIKADIEKDPEAAKRLLALMPVRAEFVDAGHAGGDAEEYADDFLKKQKGIMKIAERMAKDEKKEVSACMRAAMKEYVDAEKQKEEN